MPGKVLFVSSEANIQKNTLEVKVALDEPAAVFKPEMLVDVTYLAPKPAEAAAEASEQMRLYVPQQLVLRDESGRVRVGGRSIGGRGAQDAGDDRAARRRADWWK